MHVSTVSILKILFLDKLCFLNFYQNRPYLSRHGVYWKGSIHTIPLIRSFNVWIERSALLTCSFAAVVLHTRFRISASTFSNSPSIRIVRTLKPALVYTCTTHAKCLLRLLAIRVATCSTVMNLICLNTVNRNTILSTKNTSAANVTILLRSTTSRGTDT
jgi:hypothetical protein